MHGKLLSSNLKVIQFLTTDGMLTNAKRLLTFSCSSPQQNVSKHFAVHHRKRGGVSLYDVDMTMDFQELQSSQCQVRHDCAQRAVASSPRRREPK